VARSPTPGPVPQRTLCTRVRQIGDHLVRGGVVVAERRQQWGDRWIYGQGHEPLLVLDRRSGQRILRVRILDDEGRPLVGPDMVLTPGPGTSKRTRARYGGSE
jgi:hypothetical protein